MNDLREKKTLIGIIISFALILVIAVGVAAKTGSNNSSQGNTPSQEEAKSNVNTTTKCLAIVKKISTKDNTLTIYDMDTKLEHILNYNGGTEVIDRYGKDILMDDMQVGEMVDATFVASSSALKKIVISKRAWEITNINKFNIDSQDNIITVGKKTYKLDDQVFISSNGKSINLMDLYEKDQLTLKGVGKTVYSVIVTKGHGYIRLKNYQDFVGGDIEVGYDVLMPISKNMLIVAREGQYRVILEKDGIQAVKHVSVIRDQEVELDMSDYQLPKKQIGEVTFKISPNGADLAIDGQTVTDYSEPIKLAYGEHKVEVTLTGYTTYSGTIKVSDSKQTIKIKLQDETEASATPTASATASDNSTSDSTSNNSTGTETNTDTTSGSNGATTSTATPSPTATTGTTKTDYSHKITITTPEGAEVYLNGTYKGIAPVSMIKEIGTHTISLRKTGFTTKSYNIQVSDDNKDVSFTFPDLTTATN